ncbi:MAG: DUF2868 domain-containing protein [Myxococcota bacterium]
MPHPSSSRDALGPSQNAPSPSQDTPGPPSPGSAEAAALPLPGHRPGLADWLDLLSLLRADEGARDALLRRRDRALGARLKAAPIRPERWLVAWVEARRAELGAGGDASGRYTAEAVRWSATLLGVAGLLSGALAALGALSFQPQGRINVVAVLGVLVGLPGVLLVLALLNALPTRLRRALPLVGREPEGGGGLQPARWALRALPAAARERFESVFGRGQAMERLAAPVQRWLLLSASQGAAVAFQLGALATTLSLVVVSDLSFGWSTTLSIDPASAHRVTTALATPWARLWPEAVPTAELLAHTRFFRIASAPAPGVELEMYGRWWHFVVAALVTYGLLPRLVFFAFVRTRLRRGLVRATLDAPGARQLLSRMQDPLVETLGAAAGDGARTNGGEGLDPNGAGPSSWPAQPVVVSWAEAVESQGAAAGTGGAPAPIAAGGRLAPRDDLEAAARAAALAAEGDRPVALVVRAFEPPTGDCTDFLGELRRQLGDGPEIVVGLAHADPRHERVWRRRLAARGDPWLRCTTDLPWPGLRARLDPGPAATGDAGASRGTGGSSAHEGDGEAPGDGAARGEGQAHD